MFFATAALTIASIALGANAHIQVIEPPVFRGKTNPNAIAAGNVDFNMVAPLEASGSNFPCKGYNVDFGTAAGASTVTYQPGQQATFTLEGIEAAHNGGSCQVSFSFDGGNSWKVVKSFIGNCVRSLGGNVFDPNQTYEFTVPQDIKAGEALWAWSWFNQSGNREMYMNCAAVTIGGSGTSTLDNLPEMFVANVNNGCATAEGTDVEFPDPGAVVERGQSFNGAGTAPPTGNCPAGNGGGAAAPPPPPPAEVIAAPPPAAAPPAAGGATHTVAAGEFCESIAASRGVSVAQIIANNPAVNAGCTNLQVGQVLNLRRRSRIMREYY